MEARYLGIITLGRKVRITDPCYDLKVWCSGEIEITPGEYECTECIEEGRVARLVLQNKDFSELESELQEVPFEVGVDSGQAGVFDLDYYKKNQPSYDWYKRVCDITLGEQRGGTIDGAGVVTESGWGDGGYTAFVTNKPNGETNTISIIFF